MTLTNGLNGTFWLWIFGKPYNCGVVGLLGMSFLMVSSANCDIFVLVDIFLVGSFLSLL